MDCPEEPRVRTKVPMAHAKAKRRKWDRLILLTRRGFTRNGVWTKGTKTGVSMSDDRSFVGWREDCEQTHVTSVSSFSLESSEWVKTNLDTRAGANTLPSNFSPEGVGDGNFHDWIPDGEAWQFQGYDENGFPRSLDGRLMGAYEVLNSNASASASAPAHQELRGSHAKNHKTSM